MTLYDFKEGVELEEILCPKMIDEVTIRKLVDYLLLMLAHKLFRVEQRKAGIAWALFGCTLSARRIY